MRITAAPGSHLGQVTVASFTPDGWIGADSAALVRVTTGTAQLLVTVYQTQDSKAAAPQLQVVRLSGETDAVPVQAAPQQKTAPVPAASATPEEIQVVAHIYGRGDVAGRLGDWMGEAGSQRWIEGFGLAPGNGIASSDIEYQAVLGRGWLSPWSEGGQFCGSRGMSLPILGIRVRLKGAAAKTQRVVLSASFVDGTRIGPVGDGEECEAPSLAALEAFQVTLMPLNGKPAARAPAKTKAKEMPAAVPMPVPEKPTRKQAAKPAASSLPASKPGRKAATKVMPEPVAAPVVITAAKSAPKKPKVSAAETVAAKPAMAKPSPKAPGNASPKPVGRPATKRTPPTTRRR